VLLKVHRALRKWKLHDVGIGDGETSRKQESLHSNNDSGCNNRAMTRNDWSTIVKAKAEVALEPKWLFNVVDPQI
jgi:hypothetical protein